MAGNPFDQFDSSSAPQAPMGSAGSNPFDQFDNAQSPAAAAPQDAPDPVLATVRELLRRGASSHDIHLYLQSVKRDNIPGVDSAASFIAANPNRKDEVAVLGDGIASPKLESTGAADTFARSVDNGWLAGFGDKIVSGINAVLPIDKLTGSNVQSVWDGKSLSDAYYHNLDLERGATAANDREHPIISMAGNVSGAIASPVTKFGGAAAEGIQSESAIARAAKALLPDVLYGGAYGAGSSNSTTWSGQAGDAGLGAIAGGVGSAIGQPIARGLGAAGGGVARVLGFGSDAAGAQLVAQKLAQDHIDPEAATALMQNGIGNGVPTMLADLGNNTRALAGSVSRQPGAARDIAMGATIDRQMGQGDRLRDAISRNLGRFTDALDESDQLIQKAKAQASPLYQAAYDAPPISSPKLDRLLSTPAGKQALGRAVTIAQNEMRDPKALGFVLDKDGNVALSSTADLVDNGESGLGVLLQPQRKMMYSTQTLDYVKRGLDDIIEQYRSPVTGKLQLDEAGRAINGVKSSLLSELDKLNPDYAAARKAYAGPASLSSVMLEGQRALNRSAAEINQRVRNLSAPETEQYALGLRSAMADAIDRGGDSANKVRLLIGSPAKRKALSRLFGGSDGLQNFLDTLAQEQQAFSTYAAVNSGSPTATRLAEDANNSGALSNLISWGEAAGKGKAGLIRKGISSAADLYRYGAGQAGQRTRENAASLLFTSSPDDFANALQAAQAASSASAQRLNTFTARVGRVSGSLNDQRRAQATVNDFLPQY